MLSENDNIAVHTVCNMQITTTWPSVPCGQIGVTVRSRRRGSREFRRARWTTRTYVKSWENIRYKSRAPHFMVTIIMIIIIILFSVKCGSVCEFDKLWTEHGAIRIRISDVSIRCIVEILDFCKSKSLNCFCRSAGRCIIWSKDCVLFDKR